jgi:adenylosuccinate lyase
MHPKYETEEMKEIWSEENKYRVWWDIERAALVGRVETGDLEAGFLEKIDDRVEWDTEKIAEIEARIRHDMLAFLENVEESLGELSAHVHRGLTSSDIKDTSTAIRISNSLEILISEAKAMIELLASLAKKHKDTVMIGRTHGVHAEPTTFGLRCLNWREEWKRQLRRLENARAQISVGKMSGAVGTFAQLPPEVEESACAELGIDFDPVSSQIIQRDRHAEVLSVLANLAGTIEKMAVEVRNLQRTEIREVQERFDPDQKGSSAMPHKKNPIIAERLSGQARCLRGYATAAFETEALWHERDLSNSSTERIIFPDALNLIHYMVKSCRDLFENLGVFAARMRDNIDLTRGVIYSQKVMIALVDSGWERTRAYEMVQALASESWETGKDFKRLVREQPEISAAVSEEKLDYCFSPESFLENLDAVYRRALGDG